MHTKYEKNSQENQARNLKENMMRNIIFFLDINNMVRSLQHENKIRKLRENYDEMNTQDDKEL